MGLPPMQSGQQPQAQPRVTQQRQPAQLPPEARNDARASLEAFGEMGPQYSDAVIDSFLSRVSSHLGTQEAREAELEKRREKQDDKIRGSRIAALSISLGIAIPLTAIASDYGLIGMAMAWGGVLFVAFVTTGIGFGRNKK